MIFNFKHKELRVELKDRELQRRKAIFKKADNLLNTQEEINKKLANGIIIKLYTATGHNK